MDSKSSLIFLTILTISTAKILTETQKDNNDFFYFQKSKEPIPIPIEAILPKVNIKALNDHKHESLHEEASDREKRQTDEDAITDFICSGKVPGEYFRLVAGEHHCGDVVACTVVGLAALRCPARLRFHLEKQICDWEDNVQDCDVLTKKKIPVPLFKTDEPICDEGFLACGDGMCLEKELFCDDNPDCSDGSDENQCDSENDPNRADSCDTSQCGLPNCFCSPSGKDIPGGFNPEDTPQMITISWDDAVNVGNFPIFQRIFNGKRKNPNGCDIKSTFFVSHTYTNYSMVQELYQQGHEIATHSITHKYSEDYWSEGSKQTWSDEMDGAREITETFANIPQGEIVGSRAPFLRVGGNRQFSALHDGAFLYDSTLVAPYQNPPLWPYTLFFKMPHPCHGSSQKCPTRSFVVWEMVMNELENRKDPENEQERNFACAMLDSCHLIKTPSSLYNILNTNFKRHYDQNRAPFGIYLHAAFFLRYPELLDTFESWLDEVLEAYSDVYFVSMRSVLKWMEHPVSASEAGQFEPWKEKCRGDGSRSSCGVARDCRGDGSRSSCGAARDCRGDGSRSSCGAARDCRGDGSRNSCGAARDCRGDGSRSSCGAANDCLLWNKDEGEVVTAHMATCNPCPRALPWIRDPKGEGKDL